MAENGNTKIREVKNKIAKGLKEWFAGGNGEMYIILYIVWPFLLNIIIESLARKTFFGGIIHLFHSPYVFLVNTFIIALTFSVSFLTRRRLFLVSLVSVIWLIFGISNFVLLSNRVTPFTAVDLKLIEDAFAVMNKYMNNVQLVLTIFALIAALFLLCFLFVKAPKYKKKMSFLRNCGMIFMVVIVTFGSIQIGLYTGQLEEKFGELSQSFLKNGFVYCFSNSLVNTGVKKPSHYSEKVIQDITGNNDEKPTNNSVNTQPGYNNGLTNSTEDIKTPNIVIVQLESFFNINEVTNVTFNQNPIPNFTSMMDEWDSGYFSVPVVGAGTVNTEFELLTGMNLDDFGPGEYPFKTIMKTSTCESIAFNLLENGWSTHAVHNNTGGFYGRNNVFARLGIQTFTSVEYMQIEEYTPMGWAKDFYLTDEIFKCLNSTDNQDFVYAISVQGHGSYPTDAEYDRVIEVEEIWDEDLREQVTYYANQIHEMDEFVGQLVQALSEFDEDTILVMYGDHLPSIGFSNDQMNHGSIYETQYFIWNNMGLEFGDEDLEAYEISARILESLGIDTGVINRYHQANRDTEEYLDGLRYLEYDILYGDLLCYGGVNPYEKLDIQMGIDPIEITSIHKVKVKSEEIGAGQNGVLTNGFVRKVALPNLDLANGDEPENPEEGEYIPVLEDETIDEDGYVAVKGKNFTKYSKVYVNGTKYTTTFINSETLRIYYPDLKGLDSFVVYQSKLSQTKECLYYGE